MNIKHLEQRDGKEIFTTDFFLLQTSDREPTTIAYAKVRYIKSSDATKIKDDYSFFCHIINFDNQEAQQLFEQDKDAFFMKYLKTKDKKIIDKKLEVFHKRKNHFFQYWTDKPSIEIIRVQDENTQEMPQVVNSCIEFFKIDDDKKISYQGQKLSYMLYNHIYDYYKEKNLKLWKSNKTNSVTDKIWNMDCFSTIDDRKYMESKILPIKTTALQKFT